MFFTLKMTNNENKKEYFNLKNREDLKKKNRLRFIERKIIEIKTHQNLSEIDKKKQFEKKITNRNFVLWVLEIIFCIESIEWVNNSFKKTVNLEFFFKYYQNQYESLKGNWWNKENIITDYETFKTTFKKTLEEQNIDFKSYNNIIITQHRFLIKPHIDILNYDNQIIIDKMIKMYESDVF